MKTPTGLFPHAMKTRTITRLLNLAILGMTIWSSFLFVNTAIRHAVAGENEPVAGQGQGSYVDEAEENAYRAARQEPDPEKRVRKLFEFHQKYPKSVLLDPKDLDAIKPLEDEYGEYYAALQETNIEIRAVKLIDFLQKHPESTLNQFIDQEYVTMMKESSQAKKYEQLESLAEKWLKIHPKDKETYAFLAEATLNLQKHEKYAEDLESIYALEPTPKLAREIFQAYQKAQNRPKQIEWAEKIFKMPQFSSDYMLRYDYMMTFLSEKNIARAAEYAQLTLKSADLVEQPDEKTSEQLRKVRRASYHVIATELMEKGNFPGAIAAFKKAILAEKYGEGYYLIGQCYENLKQIDEAMLYYAKASLMGAEYAEKAKARLELLYKALHNETLIGIDKVYTKAKELTDSPQ